MRFIDFFSGIGGFHVGFEQAGFECAGWCEIDKFARRSYEAMHDTTGLWTASDIRAVEPCDLPAAEIYTFGFPCQSFSIAGKRWGFSDTRGTLFFEVMRLAKARKPEYLVVENVAGLLSHDRGRTFGTIIAAMEELGYSVEWQVIDSKYYVPQNRLRVYIVGHLGNIAGRQIFPITKFDEQADCEISGGGEVMQINPEKTWGGQPRIQDRLYDPQGLSPSLTANSGGNLTPKIICWNNIHGKGSIADSGVSPCLTAAAGTGGGQVPHITIDLKSLKSSTRRGMFKNGIVGALDTDCFAAVFDGVAIRRLTPRECFRLQGFSDELFDRAAAVNSDTQLYKQAGNSVTVPVVYEIAKAIAEVECRA